jgi:hypothetical protein
MHLSKFFHTVTGKYMLSIILGLGLASLFRAVCKDKNCLVFKAPPLEEIKDKVYKYDNKCYKYNPVQVKCDKSKTIVSF